MNVSTFLGTLGIWTMISSIILMLAWCATKTAKKQAALRHFIWVVAFATLIIVPISSAFIPARFVIDAAPKPVIVERVLSDQELLDIDQSNLDLSAEPMEVAKSFDWKPILTGLAVIWLLGFSCLIIKLFLGVIQAKAMRRTSRLQEVSTVVPMRTTEIRVSLTRRPPSALTWGILRPIVILPQDSETWSAEKREAVMRHEFAHVRRMDSLSQMLALTLCAIYWFNPLVWLSARAMRADAEIAADDAVVRSGISPSAYAAELLQIATEFGRQRQPLTTIGVSLMKQSQIESRILSIVDPNNRRRGVANIQGLSTLAIGAFAAVALVSLRPTLAIAQDGQLPAIAPKIASGQPAADLKPAIASEDKHVVGVQLAQARPVKVQGKKLRNGKKQKSKVLVKPVVGVQFNNIQSNPAVLIQGKKNVTLTEKPAILYTTPTSHASIQSSSESGKALATTVQITPATETGKATSVIGTDMVLVPLKPNTSQSKDSLVRYYYNTATKKYETLETTRLKDIATLKPSTMVVATQGSSRTYKTSLAKINYQPAKAFTYRVATAGKPVTVTSVKSTALIAGQESSNEQDKAKRLDEVQIELQKALAKSQSMEAERNAALTQLKKAQIELELARTKQSKSKKSKRLGIKSKQGQLELEQALIHRDVQAKQLQDETKKLDLRRVEHDRLLVDQLRSAERYKTLKDQQSNVAKKRSEADRAAALKNLQRNKEAFDAARKRETESEAKRRKDQAEELEKRTRRDQETKAAQDKALADKKKSGGS